MMVCLNLQDFNWHSLCHQQAVNKKYYKTNRTSDFVFIHEAIKLTNNYNYLIKYVERRFKSVFLIEILC